MVRLVCALCGKRIKSRCKSPKCVAVSNAIATLGESEHDLDDLFSLLSGYRGAIEEAEDLPLRKPKAALPPNPKDSVEVVPLDNPLSGCRD